MDIKIEYKKITNVLSNTSDKVPRFITNQSGGAYDTNKQIRFKTSMLKSDLCDTVMHILLLKELLLLVLQMEPIILETKKQALTI